MLSGLIKFNIVYFSVMLPEVHYDQTLDTKTVDETIMKPLVVQTVPVSATYAIFDE